MKRDYELVIIGGGPAGLTAGLYASRARVDSLLIEQAFFGGQIVDAELVENYPGFPEGISGFELGQLIYQQSIKFGLETLQTEVTGLEIKGEEKVVKTPEGDFLARAVIIATGSERNKLGVPGEIELLGKGVSYCATCDSNFFKEQPVAVVGGSDSAINEALHLAKIVKKVTVIHRREHLRAVKILQEKAFAEPKIEFLWDTVVDEIEGPDSVKKLRLHNVRTGHKSTLEVAGLFVSIGIKPNTAFLKGILPMDNDGLIIANEKMECKTRGIFAAGDVRHDSVFQALTAAADGAAAAIYAEEYINEED